jgi:hypothetical protein
MAHLAKLAGIVATVFVLHAVTPRVRADAVLIPLDGSGKTIKPSDFGYQIDTFAVNRRVIIQIVLTEDAAKSFGSGRLTLTKAGETVVETTLGLDSAGAKKGLLKVTLDPQVIDGGELVIFSGEIKGQPVLGNFGGFRLSIEALLAQAKKAGDKTGGDSTPGPAAPERDPQEVFQAACERLKALEPKHDALRGVSEVKPQLELGERKRLTSAAFVFQQNAVPPGKGPARAKDEAQPFLYVSVQVWAGRSQQPPAWLRAFEWKGETYQAWVQVYASDAELVRTVRKMVDEPLLAPPVLAPPQKAVLRLQTSQPLRAFPKGQPLVFEGLAAAAIHRPGPEHFKIARVTDGERVPLRVAYDRDQVEKLRPNQDRGARWEKDVLGYNCLFRGTRLFLYNGIFGAKDPMGQAGILDLYGCPELEPGIRYRLTWACWLVGANQAVEVSCEFELNQ